MKKTSIIEAVHSISRLVFTTREIAALRRSPINSTTQCLSRYEKKGILKKIMHGLWGFTSDNRFSSHLVIPYLTPNHRSYLSFTSALHMHGVISQIPQVITIASTAHSKTIKTPVGVYHIHQIKPDFFDGFDWNETGDYLIAGPEKALVDCLYLASRKKRQFAHFPELDLTTINKRKVMEWVKRIKDSRIRKSVVARVERLSR